MKNKASASGPYSLGSLPRQIHCNISYLILDTHLNIDIDGRSFWSQSHTSASITEQGLGRGVSSLSKGTRPQ